MTFRIAFKIRTAIAAGMILLCSVMSSACDSILGDDDASTFEFTYNGTGQWTDPALIRLNVTAGSKHLVLDKDDVWPKSFGIPGKGTLSATAKLVSPDGTEFGSVSVSFELKPDYQFGIGVRARRERPFGICAGTMSAMPLKDANGAMTGDSLFVSWAGLPKGAIC